VAAGSAGRVLDAVFLTHLHSDHTVDLLQLILSSWHQGRDKPQRVYGPKGTRAFVDGHLALWKPEFDQRIAHEKRASSAALGVEVVEFDHGEIWRGEDLVVSAFKVEHEPIKNAVGFVFQSAARKLVFSGDTRLSANLIAHAQGADMLVHECYVHYEIKPAPGRTPEGMANVASYHTLADQVGRVAREAQVKCLVLNHFVPTKFDRPALLALVRKDYDGPIVIGEDLMAFDVDANAVHHQNAVIGLQSRTS
jgi:ribonuclease Z